MDDIVWYIVWNSQAGTFVLSPVLPEGGLLVQESIFPVGFPAAVAILTMTSAMEQLRNAGQAAQGIALKLTLKAL